MANANRYSKAAALKELRALASARGDVLFQDLPPGLRRAVHLHWGSMATARVAANLRSRRPGRAPTWTAERLIAEIQALARGGQYMSQSAVAAAGHNRLIVRACTMFGSWSRARTRAHIHFAPRKPPGRGTTWDPDAVIAAIRERLRDGESLAVTKSPAPLVSAAQRHFGSWREAIEASGINYRDVNLNRHREDLELLDWLRGLAASDPSMTLYDLDRLGQHAVACRRRWGSLERAARAAGLHDWPVRTRLDAMSREEVIHALRALSRARASLTLRQLRSSAAHHRLLNSIFKRFGSWRDALEAAGVGTR